MWNKLQNEAPLVNGFVHNTLFQITPGAYDVCKYHDATF